MQYTDSEKTLLRGGKQQRHEGEQYQNDEELDELSSNKRVKRAENTQSLKINKESDKFPFLSSDRIQKKILNKQLRCTKTMRTIDRSSKIYDDSNRRRKSSDEENNYMQSDSQSEEKEEEIQTDVNQKNENNNTNPTSLQPNSNLNSNSEVLKSEKMKLSKECLVLEVLGKGGQGRVATFLDGKTNNVIALKEFNIQSEFEKECSIYNFVQNQKELHDYVNLMIDQDNSKQQIQLQMGSCSLFEIYLALREHYQIWEENILLRIFVQITKGILIFRQLGFFHGDIKPQNVMFFPVESVYNAYTVKFIDLGAAGLQNSDYFDYYSEQFCSALALEKVITTNRTLTSQEITVAEIYSLVRTIWIITCFTKKASQEFKDNRDLNQGIKRIGQSYPALSELIQRVIDANGDLDRIQQVIQNIPGVNSEDIKILKLDDDMKEMILRIIAKKKERFINSHSEEELEELFELFSCLGLDQRALEVFCKLEKSYENLFEQNIKETKRINNQKILQTHNNTNDKGKSHLDSKVNENFEEMNQNNINNEKSELIEIFEEKSEEINSTDGISSIQDNPSLSSKSTFSQQEPVPPINNLLKKISIIKESVILLNEKGEIEKAMQWNRLLNELFSQGQLKSEKECILQSIQYSILLNSRGKIEEALRIAKQAKSDFRTVLKRESQGDKLLFLKQQETDVAYGQICQVMGRLFIEMNSLSSGVKNLKQALKIFESINVKSWELDNLILTTLIKLSQASGQLKQKNNALNYVNRAVQLCEEMYEKRENKHVAMCLNMKSYILKQQGQFEQALNLQGECLRIRMQIHNNLDHRCIANSLSLISQLQCKLGRFNQAIENAQHSYLMKIRLFNLDNPYHNQITFSLRNIAQIYEQQQLWEQAEEFYLKTYENTVKNGDVHQKEISLKSLIQLFQHSKQNDKAQTYRQILDDIKLDLTLKKNVSVNSNSTDAQPSRKQSEVLDYVPSLSPRKSIINNINQVDNELELDSLMQTQRRAQRINKKRETMTEVNKKDKKDSSNKPKCAESNRRKKSVTSQEKEMTNRIKGNNEIAGRSRREKKPKSNSRESKLNEIKTKKSSSQIKDNSKLSRSATTDVLATKGSSIGTRSQKQFSNKHSDKELSHQSSKCSDQSIGSVHLEKQQSAPQERKRQLKLQQQFSQRSSSKTPQKRKRSTSGMQNNQLGRNKRNQNNKEIGRIKNQKDVEEKKEHSKEQKTTNVQMKFSSETEDEKYIYDDQGHSSEGWYGKNEEIIESNVEEGVYEVIQGSSNLNKKRDHCKLEVRKSRNKNQRSGNSKSKVRQKKKAENQYTISHQVDNIDSSDLEETKSLFTSQFQYTRHADRIESKIKSSNVLI